MDIQNDLKEYVGIWGFLDTKIKAQAVVHRLIEYEVYDECDLDVIECEIKSIKRISESIVSKSNEILDLIKNEKE